MINYANILLLKLSHFQVNTETWDFFKVSKEALDSYRTNANRQLPRLLQGMVSVNYNEYKSNSLNIVFINSKFNSNHSILLSIYRTFIYMEASNIPIQTNTS